MRVVPYSQIKDLAADLADYPPDKVPTSIATQMRRFAHKGLRKAWRKEHWTELMQLESITPSDHLFSLREGDADEIGEIADILTLDPNNNTNFEKLEHVRGDGVAYVFAQTTPVYLYWQAVQTDLLAVADDDLDDTEIPEIFEEFLSYYIAGHLLMRDRPASAGQMLLLARDALNEECANNRVPFWRKMHRNPTVLPQFSGGAGNASDGNNPLLTMRRGTYNLGSGVTGGTVTVAFNTTPVGILLTVRKPTGGLLIHATPITPYSSTAIVFELDGETDSANYVLEYVCIF